MASYTYSLDRDVVASSSSTGFALVVGFFFSFRFLIPLAAVRVFGIDPQAGAELRLALTFCVLALAVVNALGSPGRAARELLRASSLRWALLYLVVIGASLLWSATASVPVSAAYWCGTAADVVIALLLFRTESTAPMAQPLMKGFIWATCCVAVAAWVMPAQYDLRLGDADYLNANTIANLCVFAVFFAQILPRRKDGGWNATTWFLTVTIFRSLSKTTIAAFVLSQSVLLIQDRSMSRRAKLWLSVGAIGLVLLFWGLFEAYYDLYTTTGNQSETLTGRTAIWAYVLDTAAEHPWLGHGFDSMWKVVPVFGTFEARHAENEWMQQLYAYGLAGVVLLAAVYGSLWRSIRRRVQTPERIVLLCLLLFVLVRGLAEAEPFDLLLPLWAIVAIHALMPADKATEPTSAEVASVTVRETSLGNSC